MEQKDLKKITLETPIYHPFLGKGFPTKIEETKIPVKFSEGVQATFGISGSVADDHFIKHIFLTPVKIVSEGLELFLLTKKYLRRTWNFGEIQVQARLFSG